jgi:uncharacterized damage-inducible protein DinB
MIDSILAELDQEAATTRRVLERVPGDKLGWRSHPKSMSLGQLALHVATTPGQVATLLSQGDLELPEVGNAPAATTAVELLPALEESVGRARAFLNSQTDDSAMSTWKLTKKGRVLLAIPQIGAVRTIMLNHWYHHRGQLSVYLRLLNIPVPSIYGPSADENPFA